MRELGQHLLDVANIWLGEPKSVYGINMIINPRREVEDFSETAIRYASGAAVRLTCHYFEHTTNTYNGKIYGSKGQIDFRLSSYDTNAHWIRLYNGEDVKEIPVAVPSFIDEVYPGHMDSFKKEIDGFVGAILQGAPADNSLEEEERTMQAICASYASNRFNKTVALPFAHFSKDALTQCFTRFGKGAAQL